MDWLLGWLHACVFVYEVVRQKQDGGNGEGLAETNGNSQKEDEEGDAKGNGAQAGAPKRYRTDDEKAWNRAASSLNRFFARRLC